MHACEITTEPDLGRKVTVRCRAHLMFTATGTPEYLRPIVNLHLSTEAKASTT